jgi:flagellar hook-associated protein 3 FlgL
LIKDMSRIGSSIQSVMIREIGNNRIEMADLSRQLASGKVSDTFGGLGHQRTMSLALRQEMSQISGYQDTITLSQTRLSLMDNVIGSVRKNGVDMRSQLLVAEYAPDDNGKTLAQRQAGTRFADTVSMLNTDVAGRHLFAGAKTDEAPVRPADEILNGSGSKAGFAQIMDERLQADIGASGLGRLVLAPSSPTATSLSEDFAGSPFGFKLDSARSETPGVTTTGPVGSPAAIEVDFGAPLPAEGEQIFITLTLPDGTQTELALTASTSTDLKPGEYAIGADAATTSANFETALSDLVTTEADTTLKAASMQAAADDFFVNGTDTAQRVDGPPFDSATGLIAATASDTVTWYTGDKSTTPARETSLARIGENTIVAYGARADEDGFTDQLKQLAILASATFDASDANGQAQYAAMTDRASGNLGGEKIDRIIGEMGIAQGDLNEANERFITRDDLITGFLADIETADIDNVAAKLLSMQTQLQASYQVTSMLSNLSLVNFL